MSDKVKAWQRGEFRQPSDAELIVAIERHLLLWEEHRSDGCDALASHELDLAIELLHKIREDV